MITLELARYHLKVDDDDPQENNYISLLIEASTSYVSSLTNIPNDPEAPETYKVATLLLIAHWYANREAVSEGLLNKVPYGFSMLLDSLRPARGFF